MKITSYSIIKEDSTFDNKFKLHSYLSNVNDVAKNLSKNTGIRLKADSTNKSQNLDYEYNINNIKFRLYSDYNDVTTTRAEHAYAFYDNKLHIISNRRMGDDLVIEFDSKSLTEIVSGVKYKIKDMEGRFQSITDSEDFEYFQLLDPKVIRLSKKKSTQVDNQETEQKNIDFKPNADVDLVLYDNKGKNVNNIKGGVKIESMSNNGYKYRIYTQNAIYILTLDKPFLSKKDMVYNVKLATKTDSMGNVSTTNNILLKNNKDIKYN